MHAVSEEAGARLIHRLRPLPSFPFCDASVAICRPSHFPLSKAALQLNPPLSIDGYTAKESQQFCRAALHLHARHQLPYVLSRVAASRAIAQLVHSKANTDVEDRVVFTGSRASAADQYGCELGLSHEDSLGAAVAWLREAPPCATSPRSRDTFAQPSASTEEDRQVATRANSNGESSARHKSGSLYAIDVCPLAEVHRVRRRFPQLGRRWMPQCEPSAPADVTCEGLHAMHALWPSLPFPCAANCGRSFQGDLDPSATALSARRRNWWRHMPLPCSDAAEAYAALVLAQHWAARECAIKLLGISGRSFSYDCVQRDKKLNSSPPGEAALPFTTSFFQPHALYRAVIGGVERAVWERERLQPVMHLYSWVEWCAHRPAIEMPYAVVVASCRRESV